MKTVRPLLLGEKLDGDVKLSVGYTIIDFGMFIIVIMHACTHGLRLVFLFVVTILWSLFCSLYPSTWFYLITCCQPRYLTYPYLV